MKGRRFNSRACTQVAGFILFWDIYEKATYCSLFLSLSLFPLPVSINTMKKLSSGEDKKREGKIFPNAFFKQIYLVP